MCVCGMCPDYDVCLEGVVCYFSYLLCLVATVSVENELSQSELNMLVKHQDVCGLFIFLCEMFQFYVVLVAQRKKH